jgi:alpha-glucosidase
MDFTCAARADAFRVTIGKHQGSYAPWWKEIRVELFGWSPKKGKASLDGVPLGPPAVTDRSLYVTVPDNGRGEVVEFE